MDCSSLIPPDSDEPAPQRCGWVQQTLRKEVSFSGIGVHTGVDVEMVFRPAPPGTGIVFCRVDLEGAPAIPARLQYVTDTARCTTLGKGDFQVKTVEHVLAALRAYSVTNLYVDVTAEEPPVGNGSSDVFVEMIEEAGLEPQGESSPIVLKQPVYWSEGDVHLVAIPYDGFRVSYTLSYPQSPVLKAQYASFEINPEVFKREIAPCRTFSLYEEISPLLDRGLIKGGSLSNSVVIKGGAIFSKDGLAFPDEMVRHKILDLIGDTSLLGTVLHAHILAIRSGHRANVEFARRISEQLMVEV